MSSSQELAMSIKTVLWPPGQLHLRLYTLRTGFPEKSSRTHAKTGHTWAVALRNTYSMRDMGQHASWPRHEMVRSKGTGGRDREVELYACRHLCGRNGGVGSCSSYYTVDLGQGG